MTEDEVLALDDAHARQAVEHYEPFDLKWYPERAATFDESTGKWWVHYWREPNRMPGDHFSIEVNDSTRTVQLWGGA